MYAEHQSLGLTPWLPPGEPNADIGATIDFMLTDERGMVMIDAGPGYGSGAHPCCFISSPVEGIRWMLAPGRSEEHTSELQSLMRISYAVFCLKNNKKNKQSTYKE